MSAQKTDPSAPDFDYFGLCPVCGKNDGYLNIGKTHVFFCEKHRARWTAGQNLFSGWIHEDEVTWIKNAKRLSEYADVPPIHQARHAANRKRLTVIKGGRQQ